MGEIQVTFTGAERQLLINLLDRELRDTRVEERHTDFSPQFLDEVKQEEQALRNLLAKLRPVVA